ncbi:MAG TPA: peptidyl-prolyl cis-trans isomerase [Myxococcota bacterium]|nr:peptidyl-prolyl cis-trans isomerase [Myxococcota bacterium]
MGPIPSIAAAVAAAAFAAGCSPRPELRTSHLVSAGEVSAFYERNPTLFAERKVYAWRQLATEQPAARFAALLRPRGMDEVEAWLRDEGIEFRAARATRPAEDVPLALLPRLASMHEGEIAILASAHGTLVVELVEAQRAPMSQEDAAPLIEKYLAGRRRAELARDAIRT